MVAAGGTDKQIKLYKIKSYPDKVDPLYSLKSGHKGVINDLCKLDEDRIASACADNHIRVFNLSS